MRSCAGRMDTVGSVTYTNSVVEGTRQFNDRCDCPLELVVVVVVVRSHQRWNRSQEKNRVKRGRMNDHKPFKDRTRPLVRCRLRG